MMMATKNSIFFVIPQPRSLQRSANTPRDSGFAHLEYEAFTAPSVL